MIYSKWWLVIFNFSNLENYIKDDITVFVDVTAKWCITCAVNKKLVLDDKEIIALFDKNNVKFRVFPSNLCIRHGMEISFQMIKALKQEIQKSKETIIRPSSEFTLLAGKFNSTIWQNKFKSVNYYLRI